MEKKLKVMESRKQFDKTLASPDLSNEDSIKCLVKDQLLRSKLSHSQEELQNVVQRRSLDVSNFLEMLRSASGNDKASLKSPGSSHKAWKLKQDTDELRVMYREGPEGTPFHTLLVEGYVDGPVDASLCVSWESTLYKTWWPEYSFPTFKIVSSHSLQKVRVGEEISLVRMKVPWPMAEREAILHNLEIECFQEDIVLVLINTIPTSEHICMSTHGFTKDGIPEVEDTVRIDLVGGFALQKLTPIRSYFRAIANMDIKLDFVPPSLINFISRQLIGHGHKLYQKAVASVLAGNKQYQDALKGAMYSRIHESLYSSRKTEELGKSVPNGKLASCFAEDIVTKTLQVNNQGSAFIEEIEDELEDHKVYSNEREQMMNGMVEPQPGKEQVTNGMVEPHYGKEQMTNGMAKPQHTKQKDEASISPEVKHALAILDQAIAIFHDPQPTQSSKNNSTACHKSGTLNAPNVASYSLEIDLNEKTEQYIAHPETGGHLFAKHMRSSKLEIESVITRNTSNKKESHSQTTTTVEDRSHSPSKQQYVLDRASKVFDEVNVTSNGNANYANRDLSKLKKKKKRKNCCMGLF